MTGVLIKRGNLDTEAHTCRENTTWMQGLGWCSRSLGTPKIASKLPEARKEAPEGTNPADTLASDFQPPELWDNESVYFQPPSLWSFVTASLGDKYTAWSSSYWTCFLGERPGIWTFQKPLTGFWGQAGAGTHSSVSLPVLSLGGHRYYSRIWSPAALVDLLGGF